MSYINVDGESGWPVWNYAYGMRNLGTPAGPSRTTMIRPRLRFSFVIEFILSPQALQGAHTNLSQFIQDGRFYASLKSIDLPKQKMRANTLRSYNKFVIVPTAFEFEGASTVFHDDDASMVAALKYEYFRYYRNATTVGNDQRSNANQSGTKYFRTGNDLVGANVRTNGNRQSMGLTVRDGGSRHFFDEIVVYDLGAEPDSINVYHFVRPVVESFQHPGKDYAGDDAVAEVSINFGYEDHWFTPGVPVNSFDAVLQTMIGTAYEGDHETVEGHIKTTGATGTSLGSGVTLNNTGTNLFLGYNPDGSPIGTGGVANFPSGVTSNTIPNTIGSTFLGFNPDGSPIGTGGVANTPSGTGAFLTGGVANTPSTGTFQTGGVANFPRVSQNGVLDQNGNQIGIVNTTTGMITLGNNRTVQLGVGPNGTLVDPDTRVVVGRQVIRNGTPVYIMEGTSTWTPDASTASALQNTLALITA